MLRVQPQNTGLTPVSSQTGVRLGAYCAGTTHILRPFCSTDVPIVVGADKQEQASPGACRVRQLPGVVVVLVVVVVVCDPPAGVGVVVVVLDDEVAGADGDEGGAGVVVVVVVVEGVLVVCARESGAANTSAAQSAPAARSVFMGVPP